MIEPVYAGEEFREFWNSVHPHPLDAYRFDPESPLHFAFERRDATGKIDSALILNPLIRDGQLLAHHVHLCSTLRAKALFKFCNDVMISAMGIPSVGWVCAETQGRPELQKVERIAFALGFTPVPIPELQWVDHIWNSKAA